MPELPEVETVKRGLAPFMEGACLSALELRRADLRFPFPSGMSEALKGRSVRSLGRRGKYMTMHFEGGQSLIIHLGMSGSFRVGYGDAVRADRKHDHVIFRMDNGAQAVFNDPRRFGFIDMTETDRLEAYPAFAKMGPEPLSDALNVTYLISALKASKSAIKIALLDQSIVAGLGNIYVCEALWRSGINPKRAANKIGAARVKALCQNIKDVLAEALSSGGSSLKDHVQVDGEMGYFQHHFAVYDRAGLFCPNEACQDQGQGCIRRITQGGRSTFYCPNVQK